MRICGALALSLLIMPPAWAGDARVCFTPGEDCTGMLVTEIATARREILVQAYGFTNPAIAQALADARRREVAVSVILDGGALGQKAGSAVAQQLAAAGIHILVDGDHAIAHNKVMVIDGSTVVTGSFNFTRSAQSRNAENLVILHDETLAGRYAANWHRHADHSPPFEARLAETSGETRRHDRF